LGLETLIHGTGPLGYLGISLHGGNPSHGGNSIGSSAGFESYGYLKNSKNLFHVFKDSELSLYESGDELKFYGYNLPVEPLISFQGREHAALSGMAHFNYANAAGMKKKIAGVVGRISGLICPNLKFRFKPEVILNCGKLCLFEDDPDYGGVAYRTRQHISRFHLGITGSLFQGINSGTVDRMAGNPGKVLLGIGLLATGAYIGRATYRYIHAEPVNKPSEEANKSGCWEKSKVLGKGAFWCAVALTTIFLNTL